MPRRVNKMRFKRLLNFSEHISANTPKFNAYRLSFRQKIETTQTDPHWLLLPVAQ